MWARFSGCYWRWYESNDGVLERVRIFHYAFIYFLVNAFSLSFKFLHFVDITEVEKIKIGPSGKDTLD